VLLISLTGFGLYMTWHKGLFQWIILTDNTRICVVIVFAFAVGSGLAGWRSIYLSRQFRYFDQIQSGFTDFKLGQSICHDYLTHPWRIPAKVSLWPR